MNDRKVVSREEWLEARRALLAKEKAFTRERDEISAARRALPVIKVEKTYTFEEGSGARTLLDLFGDKPQLVVYHFMFGPDWKQGCKSCSMIADGFDDAVAHLAARDTAFVAISRAPAAKLEAFARRMGWRFRWLSSGDTDFNYDFGVSFSPEAVAAKNVEYNYAKMAFPHREAPGASAFLREGSDVFHTYSTYGRGLDFLMPVYTYLDLTPLGRHEEGLSNPMAWVRHHDRYGQADLPMGT